VAASEVLAMSQGSWKSKPVKEAEQLIAIAEAWGFTVTSIEIANDGVVRLGLRRPDQHAAETSERPRELV
jgi:hypothetical protein